VDINRDWETVTEKISKFQLKILWLYEACSKLLGQRKQAKLQWLQNPSQINGDNQNNIKLETSRHFMNKKREYLKDKVHELAMSSKMKNIRDLYKGINDGKRSYHRRSNLVKDGNGDLFAGSPKF
jgi:hypothetical protein